MPWKPADDLSLVESLLSTYLVQILGTRKKPGNHFLGILYLLVWENWAASEAICGLSMASSCHGSRPQTRFRQSRHYLPASEGRVLSRC